MSLLSVPKQENAAQQDTWQEAPLKVLKVLKEDKPQISITHARAYHLGIATFGLRLSN